MYNSVPLNIRSECKRNVLSLLNALKYFHTYDGSFRVKSDRHTQKYYDCPFSKHMQPWIQFNNLSHIVGNSKYQSSQCTCQKMDRCGFENHLRQKAKTCVLHACVHDYLISLYGRTDQTSSYVLDVYVRCIRSPSVLCTVDTSVSETSNNIVRNEQSVNVDQHRVGFVLANDFRINVRGSFVESRTEKN